MGYRIVNADWGFFEDLLTEEKTFKNIDSLPDDAELKHIRHGTASLKVGLVFESEEWSSDNNFEDVTVGFEEIVDKDEEVPVK